MYTVHIARPYIHCARAREASTSSSSSLHLVWINVQFRTTPDVRLCFVFCSRVYVCVCVYPKNFAHTYMFVLYRHTLARTQYIYNTHMQNKNQQRIWGVREVAQDKTRRRRRQRRRRPRRRRSSNKLLRTHAGRTPMATPPTIKIAPSMRLSVLAVYFVGQRYLCHISPYIVWI